MANSWYKKVVLNKMMLKPFRVPVGAPGSKKMKKDHKKKSFRIKKKNVKGSFKKSKANPGCHGRRAFPNSGGPRSGLLRLALFLAWFKRVGAGAGGGVRRKAGERRTIPHRFTQMC